jgi:hypothetical protein
MAMLDRLKKAIENASFRKNEPEQLVWFLMRFIMEQEKELLSRGEWTPHNYKCTCDGCILDRGREEVAKEEQVEFDFVKALDKV